MLKWYRPGVVFFWILGTKSGKSHVHAHAGQSNKTDLVEGYRDYVLISAVFSGQWVTVTSLSACVTTGNNLGKEENEAVSFREIVRCDPEEVLVQIQYCDFSDSAFGGACPYTVRQRAYTTDPESGSRTYLIVSNGGIGLISVYVKDKIEFYP